MPYRRGTFNLSRSYLVNKKTRSIICLFLTSSLRCSFTLKIWSCLCLSTLSTVQQKQGYEKLHHFVRGSYYRRVGDSTSD